MAKFIKSFFQNPPDKRRNSQYGSEHDDSSEITPPLGGRRKLSISRSGRMKQSNRKRHSLSLELYGENLPSIEKPKTVEYYVNASGNQTVKNTDLKNEEKSQRRHSTDVRTPDEEIDIAFNIIDKT